jgi:glucose 1-dehydrogenase
MALRMAQEGAHLVVSDVRPDPVEGGEPTEVLIGRAGGRAERINADVSRWEDIDQLVSRTVERCGRLDVLVNNAAIAGVHSKPLLETTEEDWDAIMAVNLRGVFLCCKRAIAEMLGQEPIAGIRGRVINISSQHGMVGAPGHVAYSTSKGGVINLTRQLAVDYGRQGILVNAVAPGKILTGSSELSSGEPIEYSHARTPFFRLGQPSDVAAAAAFLASDDAVYISGTNLLVDGGWMAY